MGVLVIKIKTTESYTDWLSKNLLPYDFRNENNQLEKIEEDHIEIDYNELPDLIEWLDKNQDKCKKIVKNSQNKVKSLLDETKIMNSLLKTINSISLLQDKQQVTDKDNQLLDMNDLYKRYNHIEENYIVIGELSINMIYLKLKNVLMYE